MNAHSGMMTTADLERPTYRITARRNVYSCMDRVGRWWQNETGSCKRGRFTTDVQSLMASWAPDTEKKKSQPPARSWHGIQYWCWEGYCERVKPGTWPYSRWWRLEAMDTRPWLFHCWLFNAMKNSGLQSERLSQWVREESVVQKNRLMMWYIHIRLLFTYIWLFFLHRFQYKIDCQIYVFESSLCAAQSDYPWSKMKCIFIIAFCQKKYSLQQWCMMNSSICTPWEWWLLNRQMYKYIKVFSLLSTPHNRVTFELVECLHKFTKILDLGISIMMFHVMALFLYFERF
jgi:hypothetical protein